MNPVLQALSAGSNAEDVISFLSQHFPKLRKKIAYAISSGTSLESIIDHLSKTDKKKFHQIANSDLSPEDETTFTRKTGRKLTQAEQASFIEARKEEEFKSKAKKVAGGVALAAGGIGAAYGIRNILSRGTGAIMPSEILPAQKAIGYQQKAIGYQSPRGLPAPGIPGGTKPITPKTPTGPTTTPTGPTIPMGKSPQPTTPNAPDVASKAIQSATGLNLMRHIQDLSKRFNDPKAIAGVLYNQFPKEMQKFQLEVGKPMEEAIEDIISSMPETEQQSKLVDQQEIENIEPSPIKLEKKTKVITPEGDIGEIAQISGKNALIQTEEGKKNEKLDKLEAVTPEFNDVLENYEKLIESIPEEYKSSNINFIGFDPDRKKLSVRFHSGDQYNYEDLEEEDMIKIAEAFHLAKTSGKNEYGAWSPNDPSRGAGIHKLIMELQKKYGGKGKEYSAKFKTLYDYYALPKRLLEEKKKRLKDEERARKKSKKT